LLLILLETEPPLPVQGYTPSCADFLPAPCFQWKYKQQDQRAHNKADDIILHPHFRKNNLAFFGEKEKAQACMDLKRTNMEPMCVLKDF
jgi:hypothetical protein